MSAATGLRAGLIGLGAMGRNHARVLSQLDGVELVGVLDPAPGAGAPHGVPVVSDLDQLLALRVFVRIAESGGFSKAADAIARLQHVEVGAGALKLERGGKAGEPGADDDDVGSFSDAAQ